MEQNYQLKIFASLSYVPSSVKQKMILQNGMVDCPYLAEPRKAKVCSMLCKHQLA